jgi:hypothetical protein
MPYRRGAPKGNRNRLKHGRRSAAAKAERKLVRETLRTARSALVLAKFAVVDARELADCCKMSAAENEVRS